MSNSQVQPPTADQRLWTLVAGLCDGEVSAAERLELESRLADDESARLFYAAYMDLHGRLLWRFRSAIEERGERRVESRESRVESESSVLVESGEWRVESEEAEVESRESSVESGIQRPKTQDLRPVFPNPPIPTFHSPLSTLHSWAISYAVATVLLGIALLGAWFSTITHPDVDSLLAKNNSRRVTPSGVTANEHPQFTFVGKVSGMVDCQFADSSTSTVAGAAISLNRRYALKSGLMEITYDSGAKVILQGPCDYTVESRSSGFLQVGKLVARVGAGGGGRGAGDKKEERGERREESAKNQKSEIRNQKSSALTLSLSGHREVVGERGQNFTSSRLSTLNSRLFAVRTPTALVEDLGTEFGVEVLQSGETASHVFAGRVVMRTEGAGGGGRGAGDEKSKIQHPTSEILLSAGQSARVEKDAKTGEMKLLSGEKDDSSAQVNEKFVRRLREPPKFLDLLDIVAGGNGTGNRRERGIDPTTAMEAPLFIPQVKSCDRQFRPVVWHDLIDGVFVPDGENGPVQIDSAEHFCAEFPDTTRKAFGSIWARAADIQPDNRTSEVFYWIYAMDRGNQFQPDNRGLLGLCPNAGITFDLEMMRRRHKGVVPVRFRATAGMADASSLYPAADGMADLWVFVNGQLKLKRVGLRPQDGTLKADIALGPTDRFLTLAVTDGGNGLSADWVVFGDPVILVQPIPDIQRPQSP